MPPPAHRWAPDILGAEFLARTLPLAGDDEGDVVATLVKYVPAGGRFTVLYLHGWSDYFFQTELAAFWQGIGADFYALDLRKYGRSMREHQTPGYVEDLATYDEDISAALGVIAAESTAADHLVLMGHSTGGLVASLWAHHHPGRLDGLVLNAPWLDVPGSTFLRTVSTPLVEQLARLQPKEPLPRVDPGFYGRTIAARREWEINEHWRPPYCLPVRPGWLRAILDAHADVAGGLHIDVPILAVMSAHSHISPIWSSDMDASDVVVDVGLVARRALELGPVVTVARVEGAVHDVVLSRQPARERAYGEMRRWARGYLPG